MTMLTRACFTLVMLSVSVLGWSQNTAVLTGKITDNKSNPLPEVSVHLLNTNLGGITDKQGTFTISKIPFGKYIIQISAIGYATVNRDIALFQEQTQSFDITLSDASAQLDAVTVSAQKTEESLQKIPFSLTALSSRQVQEYRLWNNKEVTAIVPNLYSADPGDNRNVTSIRGITSTSYDPAVATYVDGVNQFNLDTYIAQLYDVERIEILRGPQGTLYGRNAMGGVINIITKQPTNISNAIYEVSFGNYNQQRYSVGLRLPVVKNKLFAGWTGMITKRNGYYTNEFNNSSFDKQQTYAGNYYLKYLFNDTWTVTLNVKHLQNRNHGTFPLVNGVEEAFNNPFRLNQNAITKMIDNIFNGSLSLNHFGRILNFSSQTAWQSNRRIYDDPIDGDFSPIDGVTIINDYGNDWNKVKVFTQEFKISSRAASTSPLKWTAGLYGFYQKSPGKQATHFGEDAGLIGVPDKNFSIINTTKGKNSGGAVYSQITYAVTDKFDIIAGLRYDYEKKKLSVLGEYQKDPDPNPLFETQPDTSASVHFSAFSPKFGLMYRVNENSSLFATYARGYRTGGLTQLSSDPSQPPLYPYKPEYSNNFEIGIKNNLFNNRVRLNVVAFVMQVADAQVPTLILPEAITITRNAGKLTSKGIEVELAATPIRNLQFDYNFGYTDAKYKTLKLSQGGSTVNLDGNKQIFTPDITSMLALQFSHGIGTKQNLKVVLRGEWKYLGSQYFDLANTIRQGSYHLFNTRFGIDGKNLGVFLWGRNVTNKKYIAYAYDFGAVHLGDPGTYGITIVGRL